MVPGGLSSMSDVKDLENLKYLAYDLRVCIPEYLLEGYVLFFQCTQFVRASPAGDPDKAQCTTLVSLCPV